MLSSFLVQWLDDLIGKDENLFFPSVQMGSNSGSSQLILYNKRYCLASSGIPSLSSMPFTHIPVLSSHAVDCPYIWASLTHTHIQIALSGKPDWLEVYSMSPCSMGQVGKALCSLHLLELSSSPWDGYRKKVFLWDTFCKNNNMCHQQQRLLHKENYFPSVHIISGNGDWQNWCHIQQNVPWWDLVLDIFQN